MYKPLNRGGQIPLLPLAAAIGVRGDAMLSNHVRFKEYKEVCLCKEMPGSNILKGIYKDSPSHCHHSLPHGPCDKLLPPSHFCTNSTSPSKFSHIFLNNNQVLLQVKNPLVISFMPHQELLFLPEHHAVHPKLLRCGTEFCFSVV